MERKSAADQSNRVYEKFEPSIEWAREAISDTLIVSLPGFRKEQLKVQVTTSNKLRISGERPLGNNKWSSFRKEFLIPSIYDANEITAKFYGGQLFIKHPKIITPASYQQEEKPKVKKAVTETPKPESDYSQAQQEEKPKAKKAVTEAPKPKSDYSQAQQVNPQKSGKVYPPKTSVERQAGSKANNGEAKASFVEAKTPATQKSEDLDEQGKITSGENATMEKYKKVDEGKEAAGSSNSYDQRDNNKFRTEDLKQALGGLVMELKQRKKFMNLAVAVLLVLVACIYAKSAIGYIGKSKI